MPRRDGDAGHADAPLPAIIDSTSRFRTSGISAQNGAQRIRALLTKVGAGSWHKVTVTKSGMGRGIYAGCMSVRPPAHSRLTQTRHTQMDPAGSSVHASRSLVEAIEREVMRWFKLTSPHRLPSLISPSDEQFGNLSRILLNDKDVAASLRVYISRLVSEERDRLSRATASTDTAKTSEALTRSADAPEQKTFGACVSAAWR